MGLPNRGAKRLRNQAMLAGDGSDEIFGGNARYAKQQIFEAYQGVPVSQSCWQRG